MNRLILSTSKLFALQPVRAKIHWERAASHQPASSKRHLEPDSKAENGMNDLEDPLVKSLQREDKAFKGPAEVLHEVYDHDLYDEKLLREVRAPAEEKFHKRILCPLIRLEKWSASWVWSFNEAHPEKYDGEHNALNVDHNPKNELERTERLNVASGARSDKKGNTMSDYTPS
ncbi:hypothetical protein BV898_12612 [Hypsibius exemplaris]|uniref:Uncharacterized protein n=1 Tax=Hypsibius exemplaris TaxID=2072580 RepID=A0A1W0WD99_HYPEX|nr:hypothetical protein BV898_12612 [Hypsibius exemplaris]